jgi:hypothetical protein
VVALFGTFVFSPYDFFFVPFERAEDVWFGITFHGTAAKIGEVAHWLVWATFAYGLWRMRPWLPVAACIYFLQVALAHVVWSVASPRRDRHRRDGHRLCDAAAIVPRALTVSTNARLAPPRRERRTPPLRGDGRGREGLKSHAGRRCARRRRGLVRLGQCEASPLAGRREE